MRHTLRTTRTPELSVNLIAMLVLAMMLSLSELAAAQTPDVPAAPAAVEQVGTGDQVQAPVEEVPAPVEPAPVVVEPAPVVVEPAPAAPDPAAVEPAPVVVDPAPAPAAPEPAPAEPAPVEPAPADDVVDEGAVEVVEQPAAPVDPGVPAAPAAPEDDVNLGETEEDPAETSGNDPGGELPSTPEPSPTVAPSPTPTAVPSPTPTPTSITWSQPNPITCELQAGNVNALALGDTATWRCNVAIQAEITGDLPADLALLWTINASYSGDDVRFALPDGSLANIHQPDTVPGGTAEQVTYRSMWTDGLAMVVDVTVTRTSCVEGDAGLSLKANVALETADTTVVITNTSGNLAAAQLEASATPNMGAPVVTMQPVVFDPLQWNGSSWGTTYGTGVITVSNSGCATSVPHNVVVSALSSNPAMVPVVYSASVADGNLVAGVGDEGEPGSSVAYIPAGFQGTGTILVVFALSPPADIAPGGYSFTFNATTAVAP